MKKKYIIAIDPGIKNLAICIVEQSSQKIKVWEIIDLSPKFHKKNKKNRHIQLAKLLADTFHQKFQEKYFRNPNNIVLIENQPSYLNPIMKSIQMIIFSYFMYQTKIQCIKFKNPLQIKNLEYLYTFKKKDCNLKKKEKQNILVLNSLTQKKFITFFKNQNKKDDLAVSYIMILLYISKH